MPTPSHNCKTCGTWIHVDETCPKCGIRTPATPSIPTPRTDREAFFVNSLAREELCEGISEGVSSEFARTLEREIAVMHQNRPEMAREQEGPDPSTKALSDALRDAISTYGPKAEILVTEERQEAWKEVLRKYGV